MTTFDPSRLSGCEQMELPWMSSAAASPAKTSASPEKEPDWPASAAAYGRNTPVLLANYDPPTSSWRTSQHFLGEGLERFSETWPRSGLVVSGTAFQLPPLVPLTVETASGSWPTPTANLYEVSDIPALLERREKCKAARKNGNGFGLTLQQSVVLRMWPTPVSRDSRTIRGSQHMASWTGPKGLCETVGEVEAATTGALNPSWVEALMGFPSGWTDMSEQD